MYISVIFAQRKQRYLGQYAPEALEVMDEWGEEENEDYLLLKKAELERSGEFDSVVIIPIRIDDGELKKRLNPKQSPMNGEIK